MGDHLTKSRFTMDAAEQLIALLYQRKQIAPLIVCERPTGWLSAQQIMQDMVGMIFPAKWLAMLPIANNRIVIDKIEKRGSYSERGRLNPRRVTCGTSRQSFKEGTIFECPVASAFTPRDQSFLLGQKFQYFLFLFLVLCSGQRVIGVKTFIEFGCRNCVQVIG